MTLVPLALPADGWSGWLDGRVDALLRTTREKLDTLKDGTPRSTAEVLELWNDADIALRDADSVTGLLSEVHPEAELRTGAEGRAQEVDRVRTDRGLDRAIKHLKRKMANEGILRELKRRRHYMKPSVKRRKKEAEAARRRRKRARQIGPE